MSRPVDHFLYKTSCVLWSREKLGFKADERQSEFLDCQRSDILLLWARQLGKSTCAGIRTAWFSLFNPESLSLIVSATQRQAGILQKTVLRALRQNLKNNRGWRDVGRSVDLPSDPLDAGSQIVRCSVLSLELSNGSEVVSVPASPDTVRGYSPNLIVLDEAARIPSQTIDAIRPMRAAKPVKLIALTTPAGRRGWFFREWHSDDSVYWKSSYAADQCPRVDEAFLSRERAKMSSEAMFRQEYFIEFVEIAGSLFTAGQIEDMFDFEGCDSPETLSDQEFWQNIGVVNTDDGENGNGSGVYGREFCSQCGQIHQPLDECPEVSWKIPR